MGKKNLYLCSLFSATIVTEDPADQDREPGQLLTTTGQPVATTNGTPPSAPYTEDLERVSTTSASSTTTGVPGGLVQMIQTAFSPGHLAWTLVNVVGTVLLIALIVIRLRNSPLCKRCRKSIQKKLKKSPHTIRQVPGTMEPLAAPAPLAQVETLSSSLESVELFVAPAPRCPLRHRKSAEKEL